MDCSTHYLGLELKHPLVPSASPLSGDVDKIRALEDANAPAVVMFSLFEEELLHGQHALSHFYEYGSESTYEAGHYFPDIPDYAHGPDAYLELLQAAKEAVEIPIIASLNCGAVGSWVEFAALIEQAGADGLELNIFDLPTDPDQSAADVERGYVEIVQAVRARTSLPLAIKLHPFFSALPHLASELHGAGADGLVLFNRFYQPDIDIELFEVQPSLRLSHVDEFRLPLRWTALLSGAIPVDFAVTTGIHSHVELIKALMAGAKVGMTASALLRHGLGRINEILERMQQWMEQHEYESVDMMCGCMRFDHVEDSAHYIRANYLQVLRSYSPDPTGQMPH